MNTPITTEEVQTGIENLNVIFRAAMAASPSGLVAEAVAAQQKGLNDSAQNLADLLSRLVEPSVESEGVEPVEVVRPNKKN
jgi:hypothetical protein